VKEDAEQRIGDHGRAPVREDLVGRASNSIVKARIALLPRPIVSKYETITYIVVAFGGKARLY
jgi:hypothetical protein